MQQNISIYDIKLNCLILDIWKIWIIKLQENKIIKTCFKINFHFRGKFPLAGPYFGFLKFLLR